MQLLSYVAQLQDVPVTADVMIIPVANISVEVPKKPMQLSLF